MSDDDVKHSTHGATTIRASKGGGGGKWLLGAAAAVVLLGGGYFAWKSLAPDQSANSELAYNDYAEEPLRAGPLEPDQDRLAAESASMADDDVAAPASSEERTTTSRRSSTAARASTARADVVPEETIGITPVSLTSEQGDDIVVTAPRRPIWTSTPSERRLSRLYPARALQSGREGEARLHCTVQAGGALDCVRVEETPGFGIAALRVARTFRHAPQLADGSDAAGTPVNLRVVFRMEDQRRG